MANGTGTGRLWKPALAALAAMSLIATSAMAPSETDASLTEASSATTNESARDIDAPNIVVVLADDLGLMDLGVYGGEASTPHIDALAARGAMFTHFRASPLCAPSRAMLLTGMDNHLTGVATIPEVLPPEQKGQPGYTMALEPGVLTLADHLRANGYRTLMSGKWHLGETADEMPQAHGFDRSFALAASGADNWEDRSYLPYYKDAPWWEDGVEAELPDDFYSSRFIVDTMIDYLDETDADKPFFAYLPFQAVHIPVQAPRAFIDRYDGRYDEGWDALRVQRHARAQELGLVPQGAALADLPPEYRPWTALSDEERALYAARMEVHAGMIEAMDHAIGRFIAHLKTIGEFDNTIFVISSDNGPEPSRGDDSAIISGWHAVSGYDIGLEGMGGPGHWGFIGPEWAVATATPGAWFKFYATEGGIRVPLIMAGPRIEARRVSAAAMMPDIAPTLLDWSGKAPIQSDNAKPMTGRSLMPVVTGEAERVYDAEEVRSVEVSGNSALYKGDYKITRSVPPVGDNQWRLFNLSLDPGETTDLANQQPDVMADMLAEYDAYSETMGVLAMPEGYNSRQQIGRNTATRLLSNYPWAFAILALAVVICVLLIVWALRWMILRRHRASASGRIAKA